jgi:hypothetical protein
MWKTYEILVLIITLVLISSTVSYFIGYKVSSNKTKSFSNESKASKASKASNVSKTPSKPKNTSPYFQSFLIKRGIIDISKMTITIPSIGSEKFLAYLDRPSSMYATSPELENLVITLNSPELKRGPNISITFYDSKQSAWNIVARLYNYNSKTKTFNFKPLNKLVNLENFANYTESDLDMNTHGVFKNGENVNLNTYVGTSMSDINLMIDDCSMGTDQCLDGNKKSLYSQCVPRCYKFWKGCTTCNADAWHTCRDDYGGKSYTEYLSSCKDDSNKHGNHFDAPPRTVSAGGNFVVGLINGIPDNTDALAD